MYTVLSTRRGLKGHVALGLDFAGFKSLLKTQSIITLRGNLKKKNSIFVDIIQIKVDLPPSYPIFDKFIFDKVLIMLTSLPPLEFLTKIMKF